MSLATARSAVRVARPEAPSAAVLGLAAAAWLAVVAIAASPWAMYFGHGALEGIGGHPWAVATLAAGWVLMVMAMMLPSSLPLLGLFARVVARREDRGWLQAILVGAYLVVWLVTGIVMHVGDLAIHTLVDHWGWLGRNTWIIAAGTLALAGGYQFTAVKARCLKRCRTPQSFIRRHWRGGEPAMDALRMGLDHGVYCVGCCWALMLVMFSIGVANIAWMLTLTGVMVVERTTRIGLRMRAPVGAWLLAGALLAVLAR
jgi:predicted metal-binding membrane protein